MTRNDRAGYREQIEWLATSQGPKPAARVVENTESP